jgi:hypothetical protein
MWVVVRSSTVVSRSGVFDRKLTRLSPDVLGAGLRPFRQDSRYDLGHYSQALRSAAKEPEPADFSNRLTETS